jgi:hypothetical protein
MKQERLFLVFLLGLVALGFVAAGFTLVAARDIASDDLRVGPGSAKFPPQKVWASSQPRGKGDSDATH